MTDTKIFMKHVSIGGLDVSRIGLGAMGMSDYYLDPDSSDAESIRTIHRALDLGVTHIDTAEVYGPYANEELVGRAVKGRRDEIGRARSSASPPRGAAAPGVPNTTRENPPPPGGAPRGRRGTPPTPLYSH